MLMALGEFDHLAALNNQEGGWRHGGGGEGGDGGPSQQSGGATSVHEELAQYFLGGCDSAMQVLVLILCSSVSWPDSAAAGRAATALHRIIPKVKNDQRYHGMLAAELLRIILQVSTFVLACVYTYVYACVFVRECAGVRLQAGEYVHHDSDRDHTACDEDGHDDDFDDDDDADDDSSQGLRLAETDAHFEAAETMMMHLLRDIYVNFVPITPLVHQVSGHLRLSMSHILTVVLSLSKMLAV